jgi:hypothetical protein
MVDGQNDHPGLNKSRDRKMQARKIALEVMPEKKTMTGWCRP